MSETAHPSDGGPTPGEWARLGADLDRHAERQRRLEVPTALGIVVFGLLMVVLGRGSAPGVLFGGWLVAVGLLLLAPWFVRSATRRGRNRAPDARLTSLDGRPATVLPADRTLGYAGAGIVLVTAAWLGGTAVAVAAGGDRPLAGLLVVAGLVPLGAGGWLVHRTRRVGIWLTDAALVVRAAGRDVSSRTAWDRVREVDPPTAPGDLLMIRRVPGPGEDGLLFLRTGVHAIDGTALDGAALAAVIREYARPGRAAELGGPASLGTIARIAAAGTPPPTG